MTGTSGQRPAISTWTWRARLPWLQMSRSGQSRSSAIRVGVSSNGSPRESGTTTRPRAAEAGGGAPGRRGGRDDTKVLCVPRPTYAWRSVIVPPTAAAGSVRYVPAPSVRGRRLDRNGLSEASGAASAGVSPDEALAGPPMNHLGAVEHELTALQ